MSTMTRDDGLLTTVEAGELLGHCSRVVRKLYDQGKLRGRQIDGIRRTYIYRDSVLELIARSENRNGPGSEG